MVQIDLEELPFQMFALTRILSVKWIDLNYFTIRIIVLHYFGIFFEERI